MNRTEAAKLVENKIVPIEVKGVVYKLVSHEDAKELLGAFKFDIMLKNPILNQTPKQGYLYYWNVIDFLLREISEEVPLAEEVLSLSDRKLLYIEQKLGIRLLHDKISDSFYSVVDEDVLIPFLDKMRI